MAQNIAYPCNSITGQGLSGSSCQRTPLEFVGLSEHANKYPSQLSGGRSSVGIARALATNPRFCSPTKPQRARPGNHHRSAGLAQACERGIRHHHCAYHPSDERGPADCRPRGVMSAGRVVESGDVYDVFAAPQQPVTKRFIATRIVWPAAEEDRVERLHHEWSGRIVTVLIRQRTFPAPRP